jgi:PKD repeat protein
MSIRLWRKATARWRQDSGSPRPDPRGQSVVEFALIIPVFLVLAATAIDLGRIYYSQITVNDAAREGALEAARNPGSYLANTDCTTANKDLNKVMCRTLNEARGGFVTVSPTDVVRTCSTAVCPPTTPAFGDTVSIKVTGRFTLVTPLLGMFFGGQSITFASTASAQLYVYPTNAPPAAPVADFTADPTSGPVQLPVTFTDTSTGAPISWDWDFGDGSSSILQNPPPHPYPNTGNFFVKLKVTNAGGTNTRTRTITTNIACQSPLASFSVSPPTGKKKQAVFTVTDTSTNMAAAGCNNIWSWNWGDGTGNTSLQSPPGHSYQSQGPYTIQLSVSNTAGTSTVSHGVTVTP